MAKAVSKGLIILVLALLLVQFEAANKFTASFPFNEVATEVSDNGYAPYYKLGIISANTTIKLTIAFPNSKDIFPVGIIYYLNQAISGLRYIDRTGPTPTLQQPIDAQTGQPFIYPEPNNLISYTFTYKVYFPPESGLSSAEFVYHTKYDAVGVGLNALVYYTLQIIAFTNTSPTSIQNIKNGITLLKVVDIFRENMIKLIYVASPGTTLNFTAFPAKECINQNAINFCVENQLKYYRVITPPSATNIFNYNKLQLGDQVDLISVQKAASNTNYPGNIAHYSHKFTQAGYYLLKMNIPTKNYQILATFQSDSYACNYPSTYRDLFSVFQACTPPLSNNGFPCAVFDTNIVACKLCIQGYLLTNGTCLANTTCPARQYFSFGACLNVSSLCDAFDAFTGACLNCSDSANYDFINGNCIRKAVPCASNQWEANNTCFNASASCATFDPNTGKCLTCLSNLYQLKDGSCAFIVIECPQGQYAVGLSCLALPVECLNFDKTMGKCLSCIKGFFSKDGVCERVVCPAGQVPSGDGISCLEVSTLCETYSLTSGDCLSCKEKGYAVRDGKCVQVSSGLAGCAEREALGFGPCVGAGLSCHIFNLITGNCDDCLPGYYPDFTGHCTLSARCGVGQLSVNGGCLAFPTNCLKTDYVGLCTQCANSNYRLQQGQCVFFQSCQSRQYLKSAGQCIDVSPNCGTFNPSSGYCVTCSEASAQPVHGVCCPEGQLYNLGNCVDAASLRDTGLGAGQACVTPHPSLQICLQCNQGYSPDYTTPYACSAN